MYEQEGRAQGILTDYLNTVLLRTMSAQERQLARRAMVAHRDLLAATRAGNTPTIVVSGIATADDCVPVPPPGLSVNKLVDPTSPTANPDGP